MGIELSPFVEGDLREIGDHIAQDNPVRATTFIREIRACFKAIQRDPLAYRVRLEIGTSARVMVFGKYLILYRIKEDIVRIERVVHGMRDLRDFV